MRLKLLIRSVILASTFFAGSSAFAGKIYLIDSESGQKWSVFLDSNQAIATLGFCGNEDSVNCDRVVITGTVEDLFFKMARLRGVNTSYALTPENIVKLEGHVNKALTDSQDETLSDEERQQAWEVYESLSKQLEALKSFLPIREILYGDAQLSETYFQYTKTYIDLISAMTKSIKCTYRCPKSVSVRRRLYKYDRYWDSYRWTQWDYFLGPVDVGDSDLSFTASSLRTFKSEAKNRCEESTAAFEASLKERYPAYEEARYDGDNEIPAAEHEVTVYGHVDTSRSTCRF